MARVSNLFAELSNICFHFQTYTLPLQTEKTFCIGSFQGVRFITINFTDWKGDYKLISWSAIMNVQMPGASCAEKKRRNSLSLFISVLSY